DYDITSTCQLPLLYKVPDALDPGVCINSWVKEIHSS
ncbi:unnamed protein product, partial [Allacma fusca]